MKNKLSGTISLLPALGTFVLITLMPSAAAEGVRKGLETCVNVVFVSLFPFFVLSQLLNLLGLPRFLSAVLEPAANKLFGISGKSLCPFILGLTGGYPVGAAATADMVRRGEISREEGERLLPFCNNTGPAFIIGAAGSAVFGSASYGMMLYLCHIMAAVAVGVLFGKGKHSFSSSEAQSPESSGFSSAVTAAVKASVVSALNVCGFVVFFSVIVNLLGVLGVMSTVSGLLAEYVGMELHFARALLYGVFELGGGIYAMTGMCPTPANLALAAFMIGFGSISVHFQTMAVTDGTKMKCARHFAGRILHGLLSALFAFVLSHIM